MSLAELRRICRRVPFLAGGVPDLGLDDLVLDVDAAGGELDPDGGLGLEAKLVAREAREQVRLADAGVPDEHHLEEVVVVVLCPVRHRRLGRKGLGSARGSAAAAARGRAACLPAWALPWAGGAVAAAAGTGGGGEEEGADGKGGAEHADAGGCGCECGFFSAPTAFLLGFPLAPCGVVGAVRGPRARLG
jgi:hypothetical protein